MKPNLIIYFTNKKKTCSANFCLNEKQMELFEDSEKVCIGWQNLILNRYAVNTSSAAHRRRINDIMDNKENDGIRYIKIEQNRKVFVITEDFINDFSGDNIVRVVGIFSNEKKAVAKLHELAESYKKEERTLWDEENPQFEDFSDTDTLFSCWKDGCYTEEHYTLTLHESTLTN